jgi:replicative DNA helicase
MNETSLTKLLSLEKAVINLCLDGKTQTVLEHGIKPEMITNAIAKAVFQTIVTNFSEGADTALYVIGPQLKELSHVMFATECQELTPSNKEFIFSTIIRSYHNRTLLNKIVRIYNDAKDIDPFIDYNVREKIMMCLDDYDTPIKLDHIHVDLVNRAVQAFEDDQIKGGISAISTGVKLLDKHLGGGLKPGKLYTIAARPGGGKTALATNILYQAAKSGYYPLYVTIEMGSIEITERILCCIGELNTNDVSKHLLPQDQLDIYVDASRKLKNLKMTIYDNSRGNWEKTVNVIRNAATYQGVNIAFIDYIQQFSMSDKKMSYREQLVLITGQAKKLAMECNIPIVMVAQLNRNLDTGNKEPMLSHLKESGSIEQDSDAVIALWHDDRQNYQCSILKNRTGAVGRIQLHADLSMNKFYEE